MMGSHTHRGRTRIALIAWMKAVLLIDVPWLFVGCAYKLRKMPEILHSAGFKPYAMKDLNIRL